METQKAPLSIRIIYWLSNFSLFIISLVVVAAVFLNLAIAFDFFEHKLQLQTQFPVKVNFQEIGSVDINGDNLEVEFVNATTQIHFVDTPKYITNRVTPILLVAVIFIWYLIFIFRRFIVNVKRGNTFTVANIKTLKHIAYGMSGLWFFTLVYLRVFYYYIGKNVQFENVQISNDFVDIDSLLLGAIFIWILAHIFETGLKLQQEKDLTI